MSTALISVIAIVAIIIFYLVSVFNRLIAFKNRIKNSFAQIEVQLKRRYDLIPNLIETAKGYLKHESNTLEAVTAARTGAVNALNKASSDPNNASSIQDLGHAESVLASNLSKFNMVMESYPDLKANQNMMQLSEELTSTENKIAFARQAYNDEVMLYNTYKQSFPQNIFASLFGAKEDGSLLEFEDSKAMQNAPRVSF
ncbi:MAG: hypothetical protein K0R25_632 [Rickettsiaceae bacterium]|jgi:LemA protein|nr:hypothetical protein [Rickettsiaceae bacterium]